MKKSIIFSIGFIGEVVFLAFFGVVLLKILQARPIEFGATFTPSYARYLNINVHDAFTDSIDELGIKKFRIPVAWKDVEPKKGIWDFSEIDELLAIAEEKDIKLTMVIGNKIIRWPECYVPDWVYELKEEEKEAEQLVYLQTVVNRYKNSMALERWQIENEPFFPFGECDTLRPGFIKDEISLVRKLDNFHEIQQTTSGEQSLWFMSSFDVEVLGISLYREVWSEITGTFIFPYSSFYYEVQRVMAELFVKKVIISELQAEPWLEDGYSPMVGGSVEGLYEKFTKDDLYANVRFARRTGVSEIYFWGIEWWYYLRAHDQIELWDAAKSIVADSRYSK